MNWAKIVTRNFTRNGTSVVAVIMVLVSMIAFSLIDQLRVFADPSLPQSISENQMDQLIFGTGNGTMGGPALPTPLAGAAVLLDDDFNRRDSREIGEGWIEVERKGAFVAIADKKLFFANTSDVVDRPQARRSFTEVATGTLEWDFDFDWIRTGDGSIYRVQMQLGDGAEMRDDSQDAGVGVNLVWTVIREEHQRLGYVNRGSITSLGKVSGPAHISVAADLEDRTYTVRVDGALIESGIPFDAGVRLNTVRYLTDQLNEDMFSGRSFDNVVITAAAGNTPPVAEAGQDQDIEVGDTVKLDGRESSDADGDDLNYRWTLRSRPAASTARLTGADTATPSFVADLAGRYEAELVVSDGTEASEPDSVSITTEVITSMIPQFPNTFFGDVTVNGGHPAKVGMTVTAVVNRGVEGSEKRYSLIITEPGIYGAPNGLKLKVGGDQQGDIDNQSTIEFFLSVDTLPENLNEFESLAEVPFFDDRDPHYSRLDLVANFNSEIPDRSDS